MKGEVRNQSPEDSPGLAFHLQDTHADHGAAKPGGQHQGPAGRSAGCLGGSHELRPSGRPPTQALNQMETTLEIGNPCTRAGREASPSEGTAGAGVQGRRKGGKPESQKTEHPQWGLRAGRHWLEGPLGVGSPRFKRVRSAWA